MKLSVNQNISSIFAPAFKDQSIEETELNIFIDEFKRLYERLNSKESEENQKNIIADFLKDVYFKPNYEVNTKGRIDLAIHNGKSAKDSVGVIIEAKKPSNKSEMVTTEKPNVKAFQEVLLYYLDERIKCGNLEIKNLIITNISDWFIIDAQDFEKIITKEIIKSYKSFTDGALVNENNVIFYNEIAKNFFDKCTTELPCVKFNLEIINKLINSTDAKDIEELTNYYKILSPQHLLKLRFANDSNKLNNDFYNELLHIIGLKETTDGGKKIIDRKSEKDRNDGSLIENTITILKNRNKLQNVANLEQFGETEEKQLFSVGLELCITWLNRILFLKLLEGQLIKYNGDREKFSFLNSDKIKDYDELDELFFEVLAIKTEDRPTEITKKFGNIPYLNSSLFEPTELEQKVLEINGIKDRHELPLYENTVLKEGANRKKGTLLSLKYLFDFLDAYDFASDNKQKIQKERKTIINASVLGLIFEKINGYKDGSFYTPGFITEYMCRETLRKAVIQKFNETNKWQCKSWSELKREVVNLKVEDANKTINEVRICDPAVGSGHFLVSALNEMISIKYDLQIFEHDENGPFRGLTIKIENDELVTRLNGELFQYNYKDENSQRIQETLFKEKRTVIENCLFGVDINPKSVMICQLRLWVELLKNAYYIKDNKKTKQDFLELQTLPNIDINIKTGNSLISRFKVRDDVFENVPNFKKKLSDYSYWVNQYKDTNDKKLKAQLFKQINEFKNEFKKRNPALVKIEKSISDKYYEIYNKYQTDKLFGNELTEKQLKEKEKTEAELNKLIETKNAILIDTIYNDALEWRFEFPEVLNEDGKFIGFDAVIGNPPYFSLSTLNKNILQHLSFSNYKTFSKGSDIYCLFYERGIDILKPSYYISYITSNRFCTTNYGIDLRKYLSEKNIECAINFNDVNVFESANVGSLIAIIKNETPNDVDINTLVYKDQTLNQSIPDIITSSSKNIAKQYFKDDQWNFDDNNIQVIKNKIVSKGIPFIKWKNIAINRGITTGCNHVFIVSEEIRNSIVSQDPKSAEIILPVLKGANIKRYNILRPKEYLIFTYTNINIEDYKGVHEYLQQHKEELEEVYEAKHGQKKWYELRKCAYYDNFFKSKLVWTRLSNQNAFAISINDEFTVDSSSFAVTEDAEYLMSILNSKVVFFYFKLGSVIWGKDGIKWFGSHFDNIPIPLISKSQQEPLIKLVKQIIEQKLKNPESSSLELENEIDELVYKLYDLTFEEIEIIKESTRK
jgi:hypothetical protein